MINLFQPSLGEEELQSIKSVFESNWIGKGKLVAEFEKSFANNLNCDATHFLSTTSCTEAIFLAAKVFDFQLGDEIIVPSISFPSIASSVKESGADLILCDVDPYNLNVRAEDIEKVVTNKTKAVFITHYGGVPCDMDSIMEFCNRKGIFVIEDAACAVQSFYKGKACGTFGDMAMWSFDAMKTLTAGDGGMIYIKDLQKRKRAQELLYLGLPAQQKSGLDSSESKASNWWEFNINEYGRRAIMNDITAAIAIEQLKKLPGFLERRKEISVFYDKKLQNVGDLILPKWDYSTIKSSYYFYWIQTSKRDELAQHLLDNGIYTTFRYWPLHKVNLFSSDGLYENSEKISDNTLNIPIHQGLTDSEINLIVNSITKFFNR